ncbi:unnamed protein product, partial [Strongylus vulgaris]
MIVNKRLTSAWEYLVVNTYDVHFYASDTLNREDASLVTAFMDGTKIKKKAANRIPHDLGTPHEEPWAEINQYNIHDTANWRDLNLKFVISCWRDYKLIVEKCDTFNREDASLVTAFMDGTKIKKKAADRIPHDLGTPHEEPWAEINQYNIHDTANWRDLNLKFVISCWRDYKLIVEKCYDRDNARKVLDYFYKLSKKTIRNALNDWDRDHDGMIENSGTPDQTYDAWTMKGTSAYCGSLWLCALSSTISMANELGSKSSMNFLEEILEKAKDAFLTKLWNGRYFNLDECSSNKGIIMADQLCGISYLTMMREDE